MTHNFSVSFKVIHFLLWTKGTHQSSNFDTFECSGVNSSCHFPSNKSVFLQILHHSSMSWKITPLYFFSSNNIYFAQKEPIKMKIFETFKCLGQISSNSSCQLSNDKSVPLQILQNSSLSWEITPLWILNLNFFKFGLNYPIKIPILIALEKNGHIPQVIFQTTSQLKFLMIFEIWSQFCINFAPFYNNLEHKCKAKLKGAHLREWKGLSKG